MPKRKLNEKDVPEATEPSSPPPEVSFSSFGLEPRLLRGIRDQKWGSPTTVQAQVIPVGIEGRDVLLRSGTGTGKTAAYLLPILHKTIQRKERAVTSLILVPTTELATQVMKLSQSISAHCGQEIRIANITGKGSDVVQRAKLADQPDIVIATPARAAENLNNGALSLQNLEHLVIDEADLVMGYGFENDLRHLKNSIPTSTQIFLASATLDTDIDTLTGLFCQDPVIVKLDDLEKESNLVKQYVLKCTEQDKFLLLYAFYMLKLIKGKSIIFCGDVDRSYRLKLFLEQFGIKSCVLNAELPVASRIHIVEEFNKNVYEILIASDESEIAGKNDGDSKPPKKKSKTDKDSGVSRGIDFRNVACVFNFDFPTTYKSYFHRIGRTARAGKSGTAISLIIPKDEFRKHKSTSFPTAEHDEEVLKQVEKHQKEGQTIENYSFDMTRLESFRYRFADALRHVTKIAVREARLKELRSELLKSEKLSRYFEENPEAKQHIRHGENLNHPARIQPHLKHVPDYLLPGGKQPGEIPFVGLEKPKFNRSRIVKRKGRPVRMKNGKIDPLKTFNKKGKGKK
ncbi:DEAD-domain-containing protein [Aaosphaeria arxii CBS 175.79]|uniref:RNA helicase n=1 Tax=Aaosphaeria arxii CBS 175.79 TaxID=1450172 RepID=A0A6A5XSE3_9PLEO|nr:DEAD-domain-containing protein [Aaosphaeria arxii CBS 175.79]KAF2015620.1 DEAD-domain-containing protein [Aaosphaeria arxii CBS 175.79]